jgi:serine protease AprX
MKNWGGIMMINKILVSSIVSLVLFVLNSFSTDASTSFTNPTSPIFKETFQSTTSSTEVITPRRTIPPSTQSEMNLSKLKITNEYSIKLKQQADGSLLTRVSLKSNSNENEFERKLELQSIKYTKVKYQTYDIFLSQKQIDLVLNFEETALLSSPDSYDYIEKKDTNVDGGLEGRSPSEITGAKKASVDFGVTGDLDGNGNSYSKNDIVVAILDTGIDSKHVDLDDGKVIGWFDAVNGKKSPYDNDGHGTHVAGIVAGTGEADINRVGFAPGAALVGVKVCGTNLCDPSDILQGLDWIWLNKDELGIDAVNMSIGTHETYENRKEIIDLINQLNNVGIPVFVAAGNQGAGFIENGIVKYYDTLSTYAKYTRYSVGSVRSPTNGGWGLSEFSSRGSVINSTSEVNPWVVTTGEHIISTKANSKNEYIAMSGTSMATPCALGVYTLMLDSYISTGKNNGGFIQFITLDMGIVGFDKNYGNGNILAYNSIALAAGQNITSNPIKHLVGTEHIDQNQWHLYTINISRQIQNVGVTLLVLGENGQDLDFYIWGPNKNPTVDAPIGVGAKNIQLPQENYEILHPSLGEYKIGVYANNQTSYSLEISGDVE